MVSQSTSHSPELFDEGVSKIIEGLNSDEDCATNNT
jgi:hypothetical protein